MTKPGKPMYEDLIKKLNNKYVIVGIVVSGCVELRPDVAIAQNTYRQKGFVTFLPGSSGLDTVTP